MIENGRCLEDSKEYFIPRKPTKAGGWDAAIFITFVEVAERFAFYGLASNLITYLTEELQESNSTAVKNVNTWLGVSYLFPILGAYIVDSFLGRFNIILVASIIYCTGMALLASSVSIKPLNQRKALFFTALYIIAVGKGDTSHACKPSRRISLTRTCQRRRRPRALILQLVVFGSKYWRLHPHL
ncbi:protein NRT1/ PTR FAMILY 5.4-like [Juglans microcarpa x Juglans regia]|uniref:protein NRT1/ PTR FAMILY 5.4-like n=1 Tax=Juglans microcarpa x Juglans regia TaxID=2249226 RepID=UPI001B7E76CE|nr:protein NRT1/ PTR FAMILY 5.4-like [Juglans microcarpa x Juglans regia]